MTRPNTLPLVETALRVRESSGAADAFQALVEGLGEAELARALWRVSAEGTEQWPEGAGPAPPEALARAEGEAGTVRMRDDGELVVLALGDGLGGVMAAVELGPGDEAGWERLRAALRAVTEEERDDRTREAERQVLLHRAEESEALHVLGLAANRTLDPDEVLSLVARFTRTLLGAHYVTVSTRETGHIRTMAAVGLRANEPLLDDDPFAREVIDAGNPLGIGGDGGIDPEAYAFHAAEGMKAGLGVPLSLFGDTFGALVVGYRREYRPGPQDTRLALTLAGHAAVAISNARLHRTLAERSDELSDALEEVRQTSRAKERFFASMSHELRTPLNGIIGFQTLVLDGMGGEIPTTARTFIERSNRAARTLLRIVDEVLDYAKIEAGKVDLELREAAVREMVDDAVATLEPVAAQRKLHLHARTEPGVDPIRTDAGRVRQILVNLLSNAVKFTPVGGEVAVTAGPVDGGIEVRVRDSGPGIPADDQQRIFHEFEQVGGTVGGTGLGLPISRRLAKVLGGELRVESRMGHGSTFVLRLPLEAPTGAEVAGRSAG